MTLEKKEWMHIARENPRNLCWKSQKICMDKEKCSKNHELLRTEALAG